MQGGLNPPGAICPCAFGGPGARIQNERIPFRGRQRPVPGGGRAADPDVQFRPDLLHLDLRGRDSRGILAVPWPVGRDLHAGHDALGGADGLGRGPDGHLPGARSGPGGPGRAGACLPRHGRQPLGLGAALGDPGAAAVRAGHVHAYGGGRNGALVRGGGGRSRSRRWASRRARRYCRSCSSG